MVETPTPTPSGSRSSSLTVVYFLLLVLLSTITPSLQCCFQRTSSSNKNAIRRNKQWGLLLDYSHRILLHTNMVPANKDGSTNTSNGSAKIPLIHLPADGGGTSQQQPQQQSERMAAASKDLVHALQTSGFLLVQNPDVLPWELQESALQAASRVLIGGGTSSPSTTSTNTSTASSSWPTAAATTAGVEGVIHHPTDPKLYLMLDSIDEISTKCQNKNISNTSDDSGVAAADDVVVLTQYWEALERVKRQVLKCLAVGLKLDDPDYFVKLHSKNQSALRLLHYPSSSPPPPAGASAPNNKEQEDTNSDTQSKSTKSLGMTTKTPTIRCKPHSDYGSITLLLTDGVPGLEAFVEEEWIPVPYVKGALVVNIGSLLQDWTNGKLLATLHRVVTTSGNGDTKTNVPPTLPRTSLAFFADPDPDVSATLKDPAGRMVPSANMYSKSVADYIQWRSGGKGRQRSGLAFSKEEEERAKRARTSTN
jgi:isopenicillin N synthase-like dioxygenase